MWGNWEAPTRSDLLVCRAHTLKLERTKKSKMSPFPATVGSELLGLSVSFCFFLFTKTSPKWQESSFRLNYHLLSTNHRGYLVDKLSDLHHCIETTLSSENFLLLREREGIHSECLSSGGVLRSQRW